MSRLLDVSPEVRAEIGDDEAARLVAGETGPQTYACASCRGEGDTTAVETSALLYLAEETAVLAFAHTRCIPSQVIPVSEAAVEPLLAAQANPALAVQTVVPGGPVPISITGSMVVCAGVTYAALVVEPGAAVARPGTAGAQDEFLSLLGERGFAPIATPDETLPPLLGGWSVQMSDGYLTAVLFPGAGGRTEAWWQAQTPAEVPEAWLNASRTHGVVLLFAAPVGTIGIHTGNDELAAALNEAGRRNLLAAGSVPVSGV
ncbi:hypothetical protein [Streptomyces sp. SID3343]|uniref:hypothetical protein n=1 Tax=Streptomyces sp. SID3343 TaxID=2690260 RepID=UPI00136D3241|nr:hypothetical protein [Streptomyces sp. SID3343]MYV99566.1 hypothetical protein [Streptomyces sp. SID3343]